MRRLKLPETGFLGEVLRIIRHANDLHIFVYAANASYFIILAVFPALLLVVSILHYTPLEVARLSEMLMGILPEAFLKPAQRLILITYENTSGFTLGLSVFTTLWSASRGIYGLITGMNTVYEVKKKRSYLYRRSISVLYTFFFVLVLVLTLALHVFGSGLLALLPRGNSRFWQIVGNIIDFRFFLLLFVQTALFTAMYMKLPNTHNGLWDSLPGALLASIGWLIFSDLFSIYVDHFASLTNIYGSVYAIALSMLWLYFCMSILFYGAALNRYLMDRPETK